MISDGQSINAAVTNAALMSRLNNTSTIGKVDVNNTTDSTLPTNGAIHTTGGVGIEKSLTVGGVSNLSSVSASGTISSATLIQAPDITATDLAFADRLEVVNTAIIGSTLTVTGATNAGVLNSSGVATLNSLAVTNGATVGSTLNVTGNTSLSTLSTSGLATVNSLDVTNSVVFSGNATVQGNLTVNGTTTTIGAANLVVSDQNITVNNGGTNATAEGAGLTVDRVGTDGSLIYKETSASKWAAGHLGSEVDLVNVSTSQTLTNKVIDGSLNALSNINAAALISQVSIANGGTGQSTANAALNAFLPTQAGNSGRVLGTDGTNTSWVAGGSGSGGGAENYIPNPSAENNTTGWTLNNITPAPFPSGALLGGAAGLTLTRSTSNPLNGTASFNLAKDGVNRQGQMVLANFPVPVKSRAKVLSIRVPYRVVSGTFVNSTSKDIASLGVYIREFDGTNYTWTEPSSWRFLSNSTTISDEFKAEFQTLSTTISADLVFYVGAFATGAWTIQFDDVNVGPSQYVYGTPITDWISWTPTGSWTGSVTYTGRKRRVGDNAEYQIKVATGGAPTGTQLNLNLAPGEVIDTSKMASTLNTGNVINGIASILDTGSRFYTASVVYINSTSVGIYVQGQVATYIDNAAQVTPSVPMTWAAGDTADIFFSVPITGWSSSVQMSDQTDTRVVAASYYGHSSATFADNAWHTILFNTKLEDTHGSFNQATGIHTVQVTGLYEIDAVASFQIGGYVGGNIFNLRIVVDGATDYTLDRLIYASSTSPNIVKGKITIPLKAGQYFTVQAMKTNFGGSSGFTGTLTETKFSAIRVSGPSAIAASETVAAVYSTATAGSLANATSTFIDYGTKVVDTHNAVLGAGSGNNATYTSTWRFVVPVSGIYDISALYTLVLPASTGVQSFSFFSVDGVEIHRSAQATYQTFSSGENRGMVLSGMTDRLRTGQVISVGAFQASSATRNAEANSQANRVSIKRIG